MSTKAKSTVDLTGEWPVVCFPNGRSRAFDEFRIITTAEWRTISRDDRESIRSFLADKGREIRTNLAYCTIGGRRTETHYHHYPVSQGATIHEDSGWGHWVYIADPGNRHGQDITLCVTNCDSQAEAASRVREWLEDLLTHGVQGITPRLAQEPPKTKLRVVAPKAPRRASA